MSPKEIKNKRILFSPLNWGMGHVSRSISLINDLISQGNELVVACDNSQKEIYIQYFNNLEFVFHEGYPFSFFGKGYFGWDLAKSFLKLRRRMSKEVNETDFLVREYNIDIVLSDHRYGFFSKNVPSIFITHQINLPVAFFQASINRYHQKMMRKFNEIWVMDFPDSSLAGKLSFSLNGERVTFIGPYSRFSLYNLDDREKRGEVVIVSGPDIYAQQLADKYVLLNKKATFISSENITLPSGADTIKGNWIQQDKAILKANKVFSYAGYSTIMDLFFLNIEYELSATKGQYEQEYLAEKHKKSSIKN